ncbi:phosphotransferase [Laceyella tengchongensis]|uniref:phosphotransferase n=1 Tax=Laceyella tengchongensis TaxID=574699 RepID=UPI0012B724E8|nr:phosphotransferase [Laceyella tengchongensis]
MSQVIRKDIFERVEALFSKRIVDYEPIHRGLLNLKWIVHFADGASVFVKQYNQRRHGKKLSFIDMALSIQETVRKQGIRCPMVYSFGDKRLQTSSNGEVFTVQEKMDGEVVAPGQATVEQMHSLGQEMGKLHQALKQLQPAELAWKPDQSRLLQKWNKQMALAQVRQPPERVMQLLHRQKQILDTLNFSQFDLCRRGWTHWDCHFDNFLYANERVAAILDFDRMRYVYPDLDVARALLSGSVDGHRGLVRAKATAFLDGYLEVVPGYSVERAVRALRLLWSKESGWWITADIEERSANPRRFLVEIEWLQQHWHELDNFLGD